VPILVRPVREQLEHDRVIRLLQAKWRRKYNVEINPGEERTVGVKSGSLTVFPDLVLTPEGGRKPHAVVEVETSESVNHLEAMSQWASLARARSEFYLFVPAGSVESAKRLSTDHQIPLTELWTYLLIGDQMRFTAILRSGPAAAEIERKPVGLRPPKAAVEKPSAPSRSASQKATGSKPAGVRSSPARAAASTRAASSRRAGSRPSPRAAAARTSSETRGSGVARKASAAKRAATPKRGGRGAPRTAARTSRGPGLKRSRAQKRK
jgi:hypothetical protein